MSYTYSRGNTMMVNQPYFDNLSSVRLLSFILMFVAVINLVSFWAVWYWPMLVTMFALFLGFMTLRGVVYGYYGAGNWLHLMLFILICLSGLQTLVDIFLIAFDTSTGDTQQIFQYINLVTAICFVVTSFLLRVSVVRVFGDYSHAGQGVTNVNSSYGPNPGFSVQVRNNPVGRYVDTNRSLGGSPYTNGEYYRRPQYNGIEARSPVVSSVHDPYGYENEDVFPAGPATTGSYHAGSEGASYEVGRNPYNRHPPTIRSRMSTDPYGANGANPFPMPYEDIEHEPFRSYPPSNDRGGIDRRPPAHIFVGTEVGATSFGRTRSGGLGYVNDDGLAASPGPRIPAPYPYPNNGGSASQRQRSSSGSRVSGGRGSSAVGRRVSFVSR